MHGIAFTKTANHLNLLHYFYLCLILYIFVYILSAIILIRSLIPTAEVFQKFTMCPKNYLQFLFKCQKITTCLLINLIYLFVLQCHLLFLSPPETWVLTRGATSPSPVMRWEILSPPWRGGKKMAVPSTHKMAPVSAMLCNYEVLNQPLLSRS